MKKQRFRKETATVSFDPRLKSAVEVLASKDNLNFSAEVNKLLAKCLGLNIELVLENTRRGFDVTPPQGTIKLESIKAPWPNSIDELYETRFRKRSYYNGILFAAKHRPFWGVHEPGIKCPAECLDNKDPTNHPPITENELKFIKEWKEKYRVLDVEE